MYILLLLIESIHLIILEIVGCKPVPILGRHCTLLLYALSHTFTMCQCHSDVVETSLTSLKLH